MSCSNGQCGCQPETAHPTMTKAEAELAITQRALMDAEARATALEDKLLEATKRAAQTRDSVVRIKGKLRSVKTQRDGLASDLAAERDLRMQDTTYHEAYVDGMKEGMSEAIRILVTDMRLGDMMRPTGHAPETAVDGEFEILYDTDLHVPDAGLL